MDPNECMNMMNDCLRGLRRNEALEHAEDLQGWLAKGGFEPNWHAYPRATAYYREHFGS